MIPVLTAEEMKAVDQAAPEPVEVLIERAGAAVARAALDMLGGSYGKRVAVVAGKGNNGADGRVAARRLRDRGVAVSVVDPGEALPPRAFDLVIDAAFGTGFRGEYKPSDTAGAPVLAVDVPTGGVVQAERTVTFAALKPAHVYDPKPCGTVYVVDIGLDAATGARAWVVEDEDVRSRLPARERDAHKWESAVFVVAGSPGMMGAPLLVARGAMRSGAGYARVGVPGGSAADWPAGNEAVAVSLPAIGWADAVLEEAERFKAVVVGPGLGRSDETSENVQRVVAESPVPVVVDADGLNALGESPRIGRADVVLTPHEGEFARLVGTKPPTVRQKLLAADAGGAAGENRAQSVLAADAGAAAGENRAQKLLAEQRMAAVRDLADRTGAVVLLKGSTTTVAAPDGRILIAAAGNPALATAGTGDVLSGVIGAFTARGLGVFEAAAFGAHVHARAGALGLSDGLVAGDLPDLIAHWLSDADA